MTNSNDTIFFAVIAHNANEPAGDCFEHVYGDNQLVFLNEAGAEAMASRLNKDAVFGEGGDKTLEEVGGGLYIAEEWAWADIMDHEEWLTNANVEVKQAYYSELIKEHGEGAADEAAEEFFEELGPMREDAELGVLLSTIDLGGTIVSIDDLSDEDAEWFEEMVEAAWVSLDD